MRTLPRARSAPLLLHNRRCWSTVPSTPPRLPPMSSNQSSTVESSSEPCLTERKPPLIQICSSVKQVPRRFIADEQDCHSDCASSSSIIDYSGDIASAYRPPLPFDLNLLP